jgi:ComF family protein
MPPIAALGGALLDLVYPEDCLSCHRRRSEVPWASTGPVVAGLRPWDRPHLCAACERAYAADPVRGTVGDPAAPLAVWAAARSSGALVSLVGEFKYHGVRGLAWPLARGMAAALVAAAVSDSFGGESPVLVPIPLHGSRRRSRGFNQAAVLAFLVRRLLGWPVRTDLVVRVRRTGQQAKLGSAAERKRNLAGAFCPGVAAETNSGAEVVLVDDLVTSGSTIAAAAAALRSRGWSVAGATAAGLARPRAKATRPVDTRRGGF